MKQTFLVKYTKDGKMLDFFRYDLKTLQGVLNREKKAIVSNYMSYIGVNSYTTDVKIVVYKTDYETTDDKIVYEKTIKEFMEV